MMEVSDYKFVTDEDVKTEMVTPSGLAVLMGIGAKYVPLPPAHPLYAVHMYQSVLVM